MGTWGSGNLESDGALDYVGERSDELIEQVWGLLRSKTSTEADEWEYDQLFVSLEVMLALEAADLCNGWSLPPTAEVEPVLQTWLAGWSDYFDGLAGPEFKAERRAVIEETFDRFRALCETYEKRRAD